MREHWLLRMTERNRVIPDGMAVIAEVLQHWKNYGKSVDSKESCSVRWITSLKSLTVPVCAGLDDLIIPAHAQ